MRFDTALAQTGRRLRKASHAQQTNRLNIAEHYMGNFSMKLHFWEGVGIGHGHIRNFGDELNPFIWKGLLGNVFDDNDSVVFVGIGSLLNDNLERDLPPTAQKLVFGTGVGYGQRPLNLNGTYRIYCVRGPLSAQALRLDRSLAITDGALLIRHFVTDINRPRTSKYGYMPHWTNHTERLKKLCTDRGMLYIDPTNTSVTAVIDEILSCEIILAEAMHAAIIADALRVPWVPVKSTQEVIPFKWQDWCQSIKVPYAPHAVIPLWKQQGDKLPIKHRFKELLVSRQLQNIIRTNKPCLSDGTHADALFNQLNDKIDVLKRDIEANR